MNIYQAKGGISADANEPHGKDYTVWFAFAFSAVVRSEVGNFSRVPATTHLLFAKDTEGSLTSTKECYQKEISA